MHPYHQVSKRSPFGMQKEPFWNAKGLLFAMTCSTADVSF